MLHSKEHPILFSAEMVRAILDGRKTQTRRVVTVPWKKGKRCSPYEPYWTVDDGKLYRADECGDWHEQSSPYGVPGDRLWVRETFDIVDDPTAMDPTHPEEREIIDGYVCAECVRRGPNGERWVVDYKADNPNRIKDRAGRRKWSPSIHMPRWASRINLMVKGVRVERVQSITSSDARAEGCVPGERASETDAFHNLWDSINAKRGYGWDVNPWVWVVGFESVR